MQQQVIMTQDVTIREMTSQRHIIGAKISDGMMHGEIRIRIGERPMGDRLPPTVPESWLMMWSVLNAVWGVDLASERTWR